MSDFVSFARAHGLLLEHPIADGRWHRTRTEDKPRKKNGAYLWDGERGVVRNWASMESFASWRDGNARVVPRAEYARQRREARNAEAQRHAKAAAQAHEIVKSAAFLVPSPAVLWKPWRPGRDAVLAHPYLVRKGLPATAGLVHQGYLIVPMWVEKRLVNVQRISADGEKRFLTGGRAKDAVYRIGREDAREVWLVEGYATGLSLHLALHAMFRDAAVVVCFSAGNLRAPGATHVMADGDPAGREAAARTGLPTARCPDGMDANDVHVNGGLRALQELVRSGMT
jgi:putative DNA primase/helicase